jgi:hypothetical protein
MRSNFFQTAQEYYSNQLFLEVLMKTTIQVGRGITYFIFRKSMSTSIFLLATSRAPSPKCQVVEPLQTALEGLVAEAMRYHP